MYRILSLDGGGVRGIYTAKILSMLAEKQDFLSSIDLFVGTSTGSFIALGLNLGFSPHQLVEFYQQFAKIIFSVDARYDPALGISPKYQTEILKELMHAYVFKGNPTLDQLAKKIVIPAFKLHDPETKHWKPYYFHNFDPQEGSLHTVIDVALSAGAAPIFFPSYQRYIDGGVFANNPSMVGLCQALKRDKRLQSFSDVCLLSIGTGAQPLCVNVETPWGAKQWLDVSESPSYPLFSLITEGVNEVAHEQCEQILKGQYHRINTMIDPAIGIDAWEEMPRLVDIAESIPQKEPHLWNHTLAWMKRCF
jgi:patatin-like phospholipase/acyl hydrolase